MSSGGSDNSQQNGSSPNPTTPQSNFSTPNKKKSSARKTGTPLRSSKARTRVDQGRNGERELDAAIKLLLRVVDKKLMSNEHLADILDYVDQKIAHGISRQDLAKRIIDPRIVLGILGKANNQASSACASGKVSTVTSEATRMNPSQPIRMEDKAWLEFCDEYSSDKTLDPTTRDIWNSKLKAKIKLLENLTKDVTDQMNHKKFPKFKPGDIYQRWIRAIKSEIVPIPFCEGRLEHGPLINPRKLPDPKEQLYQDSNGTFDAKSYESALVLYNMLNALADKISGFLYSTITYCMTEHPDAQQAITTVQERDYSSLLNILSARFIESTEVEKNRITDALKDAKKEGHETLRDFYGRITALATDLRTNLKGVISCIQSVACSARIDAEI